MDSAISHQANHGGEHGNTAELDMALLDADAVELYVSSKVSSTVRLILLLLTKNISTLSLNLPFMHPPLRKMLS